MNKGLSTILAAAIAVTAAAAPARYSVVLVGTVHSVSTSPIPAVSATDKLLTIKVARVLMPTWQTTIAVDDFVTVKNEGPEAFQPGQAALVFADGWLYGTTVLLRGVAKTATKETLTSTISAIAAGDDPVFDIDASDDRPAVAEYSFQERPAPAAMLAPLPVSVPTMVESSNQTPAPTRQSDTDVAPMAPPASAQPTITPAPPPANAKEALNKSRHPGCCGKRGSRRY